MNQPRSRGPIARVFIGLWDVLNFSRRLVLNLLFLLVLFVLLAAMLGGGCLLYTSPSPRDRTRSRMPSSA